MLLVHERRDKPGIWEVAWTWMPYFLAADSRLILAVDSHLNDQYKYSSGTPEEMQNTVIETILRHYPIVGLERVLRSINEVTLEQGVDDGVVPYQPCVAGSQTASENGPF